MALTLTATGEKGHHNFELVVTELSTNVATNKSNMSYTFKMSPKQTGWDWVGFKYITYSLNIGGVIINGNLPANYNGTSTITLGSGTFDIEHNGDGTKTIDVSFSVYDKFSSNLTTGNAKKSGSLLLTTIPRATEITSITSDELDGDVKINVSVKSNTFTHSVKYYYGSEEHDLTSSDWSLSDGVIIIPRTASNIVNTFPTNSSGVTLTFRVTTYNSGVEIGYKEYEHTVYLGNNYKPLAPTTTISQQSSIQAKIGAYVRGKSEITITADGTNKTKLNSTISKYSYDVKSSIMSTETYKEDSSTNTYTFTPQASGNYTLKTNLIDSRTLSGAIDTKTINVLYYGNPYIETFSCERDSNDPSKVIVSLKATIYALNSKNDKHLVIKYYNEDNTYYYGNNGELDTLFSTTSDKYIINSTTIEVPNVNEDSSFTFEVQLTDYFNDTPIIKTYEIGTGFTLMNYNAEGNGIAFGKVSEEENTIEIANNMILKYHGKEIDDGIKSETNTATDSTYQNMLKSKIAFAKQHLTKENEMMFINGGWGTDIGFGIASKMGNKYSVMVICGRNIYLCSNEGSAYETWSK